MHILFTIPAYNEAERLPKTLKNVGEYLQQAHDQRFTFLIAENGSKDTTLRIAKEWQLAHPHLSVIIEHFTEKGRGNALTKSWEKYDADLYFYCDADLATPLHHIEDIIAHHEAGAEIITGVRDQHIHPIRRSPLRYLLSKGYRWCTKILLHSPLQDTQCGFKAISRSAWNILAPLVETERGWFWDTALLMHGVRNNLDIKELPIQWEEKPHSTVRVYRDTITMSLHLLRFRLRYGTVR